MTVVPQYSLSHNLNTSPLSESVIHNNESTKGTQKRERKIKGDTAEQTFPP